MSAPDMDLLLRRAREETALENLRRSWPLLLGAIALNLLALLLHLAGAGMGLQLLFGLAAFVLGVAALFQALAGLDYTGRVKTMLLLTQFTPLLSLLALAYAAYAAAQALGEAGYALGLLGASAPSRAPVLLSVPAVDQAPLPAGPVLPRIKTPAFVAAMTAMPGMAGAQLPITQAVAGDLLVAFSVEVGNSFIFLTQAECARRGLARDQLLAQARRNAAPAIKALRIQQNGLVFQLAAGADTLKDMEACSMLYPEFWNAVAARLKDAPLAIFPHRNAVYFTAAASKAGAVALKQILAEAEFKQAHALSKKLYLFRENKWEVQGA